MSAYRTLFTVSLALPVSLLLASCAHDGFDEGEADETETAAEVKVAPEAPPGTRVNALTEAPAGFDEESNGFLTDEEMEVAVEGFSEHEDAEDGLGPVFNAQGCVECHQNPAVGGGSQTTELRAGHFNGSVFVDAAGGSLINDRAIDARIQERVPAGNEVRTFRVSLSLFGDGFVECVDSNTLAAIANAQPPGQRGTFIEVPVLEANDAVRGARFGIKNQHASLVSFAADAYVNEMGITSVLQPTENTSNGRSVADFDALPDPEDTVTAEAPFGEDLQNFINLMRALKAPPRDEAVAATASARRGETQFNQIGCATCHTPSIETVPAGTVVNRGAFTCPEALGDKVIRPFGDFLLHDVGTGDGIVQNGGQGTRNQVRTLPLWGLRTRTRLMHDGLSVTRTDAISRHRNQASRARNRFFDLSSSQQQDVLNFLNSL